MSSRRHKNKKGTSYKSARAERFQQVLLSFINSRIYELSIEGIKKAVNDSYTYRVDGSDKASIDFLTEQLPCIKAHRIRIGTYVQCFDCLHNQYCDKQMADMKCRSKDGCNFKIESDD